MKISCVYAIRNIKSGKSYIGSAVSFSGRKKCHLHRLRAGDHHSIILQRSWDKHGASAFEFIVLEVVDDPSKLVEREQHWIDSSQSANPAFGYNIAPVAGSSLGRKHTAETKAKMARARDVRTDEQKAAIAAKLAAARIGWKHPPETIAKMRGQKRTDETKRKIGEAHKGRPRSTEHRRKIAATLRGRKCGPQSPETIAKRVAATRATKLAKREAMP